MYHIIQGAAFISHVALASKKRQIQNTVMADI
jgi:hypothetical protein